MNSGRAKKLRRIAFHVTTELAPEMKLPPNALARVNAKMYRELRRVWLRLNHRQRGDFKPAHALRLGRALFAKTIETATKPIGR
jgi:hypothetical protein